jgi:hypothetical protein
MTNSFRDIRASAMAVANNFDKALPRGFIEGLRASERERVTTTIRWIQVVADEPRDRGHAFNEWIRCDRQMRMMLNVLAAAIGDDALDLYYDTTQLQWTILPNMVGAVRRNLLAAETALPLRIADTMIALYRSLPNDRAALGYTSREGAYIETRKAIFDYVVMAWAAAETKEEAEEYFAFIIEMLAKNSPNGHSPYNELMVGALRRCDKHATEKRIVEGLETLDRNLDKTSRVEIGDAYDVLTIGLKQGVRKEKHGRERALALARMSVILDDPFRMRDGDVVIEIRKGDEILFTEIV